MNAKYVATVFLAFALLFTGCSTGESSVSLTPEVLESQLQATSAFEGEADTNDLYVANGESVINDMFAENGKLASEDVLTAEVAAVPKLFTSKIQKDYSADALTVVTEIENTHPIFVIDELPENYGEVRTEYLEYTSKKLTKIDFWLATQRYLTILHDGHMGSGLIDGGWYIDVNWDYENESLYLLSPDGSLSDTKVTKIGGVPVKDVYAQIDRHYYAENEPARQHQYAVFCRQKEMLDLSGCDIDIYGGKIMLTTERDGVTDTMECGFVNKKRASLLYENTGFNYNYIIDHKMIGDVFYIDLRTFKQDKSVDATAEAIKESIANGVKKFIIDVRGNSGGNSAVGLQLLTAMGMTTPNYGGYIRYSDLSKKSGRTSQDSNEIIYNEPNVEIASKNSGIELVVLTDKITFSSATMLSVWVKDGKLGTIIGQPSRNSPTAFGDMLQIWLPVSNIKMSVSYKKFLRPDQTTDPEILNPDILTQRGEDALNTALEYLSAKTTANIDSNSAKTINVNGKEYEASYFGKQDLSNLKGVNYSYREFWRLENAYNDFKDNTKTSEVLPYNNYPMPIEKGQVFVIDYTKKDGSEERKYYRSDGYVWKDMPSTNEFKVDTK